MCISFQVVLSDRNVGEVKLCFKIKGCQLLDSRLHKEVEECERLYSHIIHTLLTIKVHQKQQPYIFHN